MIMDMSIFLIILKVLWLVMVFFMKLYVFIHLNEMEWLSTKIDILLKQFALF